MPELKTVPIQTIDPAGRLREVSNLPVAEKMQHPEYVTCERFRQLLASGRRPTLCKHGRTAT